MDTTGVELRASDGVALAADVIEVPAPTGGAVVMHPHPAYGGTRHDHVVDALFRALPTTGWTTLRFDLRQGSGAMTTEVLDAAAALDELSRRVPDGPLVAVGYSFGAALALSLDRPDVAGVGAVAPPFGALPIARVRAVPTLVVVAAHDQFAPPPAVAVAVAGWDDVDTEVIEVADHFFHGRAAAVAAAVARWLERFARLPS